MWKYFKEISNKFISIFTSETIKYWFSAYGAGGIIMHFLSDLEPCYINAIIFFFNTVLVYLYMSNIDKKIKKIENDIISNKEIDVENDVEGNLQIKNEELYLIDNNIHFKVSIANYSAIKSIGCYLTYTFCIDNVPRKTFTSPNINLIPNTHEDFISLESNLNISNGSTLELVTGKTYTRQVELIINLYYGVVASKFELQKCYKFYYELIYEFDTTTKKYNTAISKLSASPVN